METNKGMTPENFYEKVRLMRYYQKEFFRTKNKEYMIKAKQVEGEVDNALTAYYEDSLFND